jgi:hypothetical protein
MKSTAGLLVVGPPNQNDECYVVTVREKHEAGMMQVGCNLVLGYFCVLTCACQLSDVCSAPVCASLSQQFVVGILSYQSYNNSLNQQGHQIHHNPFHLVAQYIQSNPFAMPLLEALKECGAANGHMQVRPVLLCAFIVLADVRPAAADLALNISHMLVPFYLCAFD